MAELAIEAAGLRRTFNGTKAVDGVDLAIEHGEIYGFLGPNGAGKSTTVRMLVTLLAPTSGDAHILGRSVTKEPGAVRLQIGVAQQEAALDDKQTGIELLRLQGRMYGLSESDVRRRLENLRRLIDIGDALEDRIGTYSGGMKRRLDLAAALIHNPRVLFLDEPTTGLDPVSRKRVWEEIRRLNEELGMTIFLTTQYLEEADVLADRVAIITEGKIGAEGTPSELKRKVGTDLVVVRTREPANGLADKLRALDGVDRVDVHGNEVTVATPSGSKVVGRVAVALENDGVEIEELTLRTPTLDDVFLEVTGNRLAVEESAGGAA